MIVAFLLTVELATMVFSDYVRQRILYHQWLRKNYEKITMVAGRSFGYDDKVATKLKTKGSRDKKQYIDKEDL